MLKIATGLIVFLGGFAVMVLETIGTRYLAATFGDSFYVWISQIGVILIALALGYAIGGALADRFKRTGFLAVPMALSGLYIFFIPQLAPPLLGAIVNRHPMGQDIPAVWRKLDPVLGSAVVFFLPCFVLAVISPYMVRVAARRLDMGVFIISPNDKGGKLYEPPPKWVELCAPLTPMQFNDLYCLARPEVHTLSCGAARPRDFEEHVRGLEQLDRAAEVIGGGQPS